jgi:HTH-type transcriptional regulator/antitoxin MqsA
MTTNGLSCPVCEKTSLVPENFSDDFKFEGKPLHVDNLEGYRCTECNAEPIMPDQIKRNHSRITDAKRAVLGFLSGEQIREGRRSLGLSQPDAAVIFGGGVHGFSKYERGETIQSAPMDRLLRLVFEHPELLNQVRHWSGVQAESTEGPYEGYIKDTAVSVCVGSNGIPKRKPVIRTSTKKILTAAAKYKSVDDEYALAS